MRGFEASREFAVPPRRLVEIVLDPAFQAARAARFGGPPAELRRDGDRATVSGPRPLPMADVPALARPFLPADGMVRQTDEWDLAADGGPVASWVVTAAGVPVRMSGSHRLTPVPPDGTRYRVAGEVSVGVPLVGGSLEALTAEHLGRLLAAELAFLAEFAAGA